jgi:Tfp pilus assembly protein FimT
MMRISKHIRGFSLIEMTVATSLTVLISMMLASSWVMLNRPTSSLVAWGQLFQEMDIAVTSLTRDLGGSLSDYANADGKPIQKGQGILLACRKTNDLAGDHLQLCYEGPIPNNVADWDMVTGDTVIDYYLDGETSTLIRKNLKNNNVFHVAGNVAAMTVVDDPNNSNNLRIELTFQYPKYVPMDETVPLTRTCILIAKKSP